MSLWSWALGLIGVTGLWLAGRRLWWGWLVSLSNEILWVAYALATQQYGFLLMAAGYGAMYARNAVAWRRGQTASAGPIGEEPPTEELLQRVSRPSTAEIKRWQMISVALYRAACGHDRPMPAIRAYERLRSGVPRP